MSYRDLKTGSILFVGKSKSFLPTAIQILEGSMWHHVGLIFEDNGEWKVFEEKTIYGIGITKLSDYIERELKGEIILSYGNLKSVDADSRKDDIIDLCDELISEHHYDIKTLFKQIIRQSLLRIGYSWKFKSNRKDGFICSVLYTYVTNKIFGVFKDWGCMSPSDLFYSDEIYHFKID
jgi:hypothetical protein